MPKGEFENRDRDEINLSGIPNLGDLPPDLAIERGEADGFKVSSSVVPADMRNDERLRRDVGDSPLGAPVTDYDVRSVYDSRPPSAYDFNIAANTLESGNFFPWDGFYVPQGYVAVLRGSRVMISSNVDGGGTSDAVLAITINRAVRDPIQVQVAGSFPTQNIPVNSGDWNKHFLIADEGQLLGGRVDLNGGSGAVICLQLYGNLLLKTGVPAQFQIANLARTSGPVKAPGAVVLGPEVKRVKRRAREAFPNVPILRK